jgi:putative addiction module component (TIGR02574 family)
MTQPAFDFRRLSVDERLRLIGDIWDSIAEEAEADPSVLPLTDAQRAELDRRLAEHERDPGSAVPWEEALDRIESRLRDATHPRGER